MEQQGGRPYKEASKELQAKRRKLHKILLDHDIEAFKEFVKENEKQFYATGITANMGNEGLSEALHFFKSKLIYLGDEWQKSRNHFRLKECWPEGEAGTKAVNDFMHAKGNMPLCNDCKYFRKPLPGEESPCMHIGAIPSDICCKAFKQAK